MSLAAHEPIARVKDVHKHRCDNCGEIWQHERPPIKTTEEEYRRAHLCPNCGQEQRKKYFATQEEEAAYVATALWALLFETLDGT